MDPNRRGEKKAPGSQLSRGHKAILLEWRSEQPEGSSRGREWDSQTVCDFPDVRSGAEHILEK